MHCTNPTRNLTYACKNQRKTRRRELAGRAHVQTKSSKPTTVLTTKREGTESALFLEWAGNQRVRAPQADISIQGVLLFSELLLFLSELLIWKRTNRNQFPIVFLKENDSTNRDFREKFFFKKSMNSYFFSSGGPRSRPDLALSTENCREKAKIAIEKLDPKPKKIAKIEIF